MRRIMLLVFLVCFALFIFGCETGSAVYGVYPRSAPMKAMPYRVVSQPVERTACCALGCSVVCDDPARLDDCFARGGSVLQRPVTLICCEIAGEVVSGFSYGDCIEFGGRPTAVNVK